jgi:hypothetical protein
MVETKMTQMKNAPMPHHWLRVAQYNLARLAEIDLRYESFTSRLAERGSRDEGPRLRQLDLRHIKERACFGREFTTGHEAMSNLVLADLMTNDDMSAAF